MEIVSTDQPFSMNRVWTWLVKTFVYKSTSFEKHSNKKLVTENRCVRENIKHHQNPTVCMISPRPYYFLRVYLELRSLLVQLRAHVGCRSSRSLYQPFEGSTEQHHLVYYSCHYDVSVETSQTLRYFPQQGHSLSTFQNYPTWSLTEAYTE